MGKATRWFKSLLGMKKDDKSKPPPPPPPSDENDARPAKRRSSACSGDRSALPLRQISLNVPARDAGKRRSCFPDVDKQHAIAVAAATAAAADAAVAAAQAAMVVVKLTAPKMTPAGGERRAAVKIQTVFRGYLAKKALRALKGLVKLQAHVRGYLVRKQAAATLHSMQAMVRAQATARLNRARRSIERFDDSRSEFNSKRFSVSCESCYEGSPKIVEIDTYKTRSRFYGDVDENDGHYSAISGPLPGPTRLSIPSRSVYDHHYQRRIVTAHSTPRFGAMGGYDGPLTPAKSIYGDDFYSRRHAAYMASTQSFQAKLRCQSAPKQRPGLSPSKKKMPLSKVIESRSSMSGVRMQRSWLNDHYDVEFYEK